MVNVVLSYHGILLNEKENTINTCNNLDETQGRGFPGGKMVKNPPANAGDMGSSPGPGRSHMLQSN